MLETCKPERVFHYFEEMCAIPHGSRDTKRVSDWCVAFAKEHGLEYRQDETNNIIIRKPGSAGYEKAAPVILQGHLDMVCEKTPGREIDFTRDGLKLALDGDWVYAEGTTLGGDDGIAVAMTLALLEDETLAHPPLEAVFTVDEEIGMDGAQALDASFLKGRRLINLDSETQGILTVSCAGGLRADCHLPVRRERVTAVPLTLTLGGLLGGHSGGEIDKGRANANKMMARLLYHLWKCAPFGLAELAGGQKDNVIPNACRAVLAVRPDDVPALTQAAAALGKTFAQEYRVTDPGIAVACECGQKGVVDAVVADDTRRAVGLLLGQPNGICAMSAAIPGLVQTSLNLGCLALEKDELKAGFSVRSSVGSQKEALLDRLVSLTELLGGHVTTSGNYPAWEYREKSNLRDVVCAVWKEQTGSDMKVEAIHAGLECGLLSGKLPGLDCVSFGPDMQAIHTAAERLSVTSTARVYALVREVLARLH